MLVDCPVGTVFNPKLDVCDYPDQVPECSNTKINQLVGNLEMQKKWDVQLPQVSLAQNYTHENDRYQTGKTPQLTEVYDAGILQVQPDVSKAQRKDVSHYVSNSQKSLDAGSLVANPTTIRVNEADMYPFLPALKEHKVSFK